jgi:hypothetical protein
MGAMYLHTVGRAWWKVERNTVLYCGGQGEAKTVRFREEAL